MSAALSAALQACFPEGDLEWRIQTSGEKNGKVWALGVPYITNRAIMQRLDDTVGPENWRNEFVPVGTAGPAGAVGSGYLCGLSVKAGEEWVTKWDGAETTDVEPLKGGLSGAMKRAAVQWGIGRYLYGLEESWANVHEAGKHRAKTREGKPFRWDPPRLPDWATPTTARAEPAVPKAQPEPPAAADAAPISGPSEHEAMLEFIRTVGPRVDDAAQITVGGKKHSLKEYVRENWATLKEQDRPARAMVRAIEKVTGTRFEAAA